MQTFLPYEDFSDSAKALDNKRLGKQRIECKQILRNLLGENSGWKNHPAVKMWKNYEYQLCCYAIKICVEWRNRGFKDQQLEYFQAMLDKLPYCDVPIWIGGLIHASHRSNLLRKNYNHYSQFNWSEPNNMPYFWPK